MNIDTDKHKYIERTPGSKTEAELWEEKYSVAELNEIIDDSKKLMAKSAYTSVDYITGMHDEEIASQALLLKDSTEILVESLEIDSIVSAISKELEGIEDKDNVRDKISTNLINRINKLVK